MFLESACVHSLNATGGCLSPPSLSSLTPLAFRWYELSTVALGFTCAHAWNVALITAGEFLTPDEISFTVLLRGYGALTPPDWPRIDATLTTMRMKYGIEPTTGSEDGWRLGEIRFRSLNNGICLLQG